MDFKLVADYKPTGDQPEAIEELVRSIEAGQPHNTLLGVTGSGKTFTIANVVERLNRPTLVLSHNKTLAAQLYSEFKAFFPENAVEYFVSYYDYYQPEAYLPASDTYIEKDLAINDEIEKLRLRTTSSLLSGRRDVIVVSSVSCLYGIGNPQDFHANSITIKVGDEIPQRRLLYRLVDALYTRTERYLEPATFRVKGDTIDIMPAHSESDAWRISMFGDEIEALWRIDPATGARMESVEEVSIFPANLFVTTKERTEEAIRQIQLDLGKRIEEFEKEGRTVEAQRIKQRVEYDVEMIKELGYCSGIENYSRYMDGRKEGERPFCLMDYFPEDFLLVVDESHVTIPQVRAMYGGDRARKQNLVEYGFRLPAAVDNRPLKFEEFEGFGNTVLYCSATPADYELVKSEGAVVEQLVRPTGLLDPEIEVRATENQIDDLLEEIQTTIHKGQRALVTTLTKRMAEELSKYFDRIGIRNRYIHSDVDTFDRVQILEDLKAGSFDVLIGVNLLREGLDLPEVALVAILDADKEGFLRSERALTQTAGRAARNVAGRVIMYGDTITDAMRATINESRRRREKQMAYNEKHGITPTQIKRYARTTISGSASDGGEAYPLGGGVQMAADTKGAYSAEEREVAIRDARRRMEEAAKALDFSQAAMWRDRMYELQGKK
ncbi:MAG: excinuclease ABC subunit UvrB [Tidjanibacter sp.]|nr:excinuclease ABC subunit UvrB [Tidjanibacter sp.]